MLLAFGALIAAGIPVLLAFSAVGAALGFYAPLSYLFPDGGSVANVVLLIGMAVGVDYSLVLSQARTRGTQQGTQHAARGRDRRGHLRDTRWSSPVSR